MASPGYRRRKVLVDKRLQLGIAFKVIMWLTTYLMLFCLMSRHEAREPGALPVEVAHRLPDHARGHHDRVDALGRRDRFVVDVVPAGEAQHVPGLQVGPYLLTVDGRLDLIRHEDQNHVRIARDLADRVHLEAVLPCLVLVRVVAIRHHRRKATVSHVKGLSASLVAVANDPDPALAQDCRVDVLVPIHLRHGVCLSTEALSVCPARHKPHYAGKTPGREPSSVAKEGDVKRRQPPEGGRLPGGFGRLWRAGTGPPGS